MGRGCILGCVCLALIDLTRCFLDSVGVNLSISWLQLCLTSASDFSIRVAEHVCDSWIVSVYVQKSCPHFLWHRVCWRSNTSGLTTWKASLRTKTPCPEELTVCLLMEFLVLICQDNVVDLSSCGSRPSSRSDLNRTRWRKLRIQRCGSEHMALLSEGLFIYVRIHAWGIHDHRGLRCRWDWHEDEDAFARSCVVHDLHISGDLDRDFFSSAGSLVRWAQLFLTLTSNGGTEISLQMWLVQWGSERLENQSGRLESWVCFFHVCSLPKFVVLHEGGLVESHW